MKDTLEMWRTNPDIFFPHIKRQGEVLTRIEVRPQAPSDRSRAEVQMDNGFRMSMHTMTVRSLLLLGSMKQRLTRWWDIDRPRNLVGGGPTIR